MPSSPGKDRTWTKETFKAKDWTERTIRKEAFVECTFEKCKFVKAALEQCVFHDCVFRACDLTAAKVNDSVFVRVKFVASKVAGIAWPEARRALFRVDFEEAILSYSSFAGMDLSGTSFLRCTAVDVDFQEAILSHANFSGTDLKDSRFSRTNLTCADFSEAKRYSIDPTLNTLRKTVFSLPEGISLLERFDIVWK
jgi:fluoroquinolone resistance protein